MNVAASPSSSPSEPKVPAVTKAVAIIRHINLTGAGGASLNGIAIALRITKSHCFNILKELVREGWLVHDEVHRAYTLSPRMLSDISSIFSPPKMSTIIHAELEKLAKTTGIPCALTRAERDGSFVTVARSEASEELIYSAPIGFRFPPDAPAQMRVRLAWMSRQERESELARWEPKPYTPTTIVDKDRLRAEIEATAARGYAISRAEYTPGVMSLAVPIFDPFGNVQMILQSPGLAAQVAADEAKIAVELLAAAARINAVLGNPPNKEPGKAS